MAKIDVLVSGLEPAGTWKIVGSGMPVEETRTGPNPNYSTDPAEIATGKSSTVPQQITTGTGRYYVVVQDDSGTQRALFLRGQPIKGGLEVPVTGVTKPANEYTGDLRAVEWDQAAPLQDVPDRPSTQETNAKIAEAQAQTEAARQLARQRQLEADKAQRDLDEMQANDKAGKGFRTNTQIEQSNKEAIDQNLTQQQIDARKREIENNNANNAVQNAIAQQNANTTAQNALSNAQANEARIKFEQHAGELDDAKFAWQKAQDEISNRNTEADRKLKELQQFQTNQVQVKQNELRAAELEQSKAEAAQTAKTAAETAATTAAASVYGTERQAQTAAGAVGGNLLSNRTTAATNLINNILGVVGSGAQSSAGRFGALGGGLTGNVPAGIGRALFSQAASFTGQLAGGQETLNAAAQMVRQAAPGAELTPQGQVAMGVIQQHFDRVQQTTGKPDPRVAANTAASQSGQNGGMTAPVTVQDQAIRAAAAQQAQARAAVAQATPPPTTGAATPVGNVPGTFPAGMFTAPQTAQTATPTINFNF